MVKQQKYPRNAPWVFFIKTLKIRSQMLLTFIPSYAIILVWFYWEDNDMNCRELIEGFIYPHLEKFTDMVYRGGEDTEFMNVRPSEDTNYFNLFYSKS